jgi:aminoglycoside phosphotransferase (APT) family kinase protein
MPTDPIAAVLIPPQLERFRQVFGVTGPIEVNLSGWYKHVVLSPDCAFLFPRNGEHLDLIAREADVLEAAESWGLDFVPRLQGRWHDPGISPYPFIATGRLPGQPYESLRPTMTADEMASFMGEVGRVVAAWHNLETGKLPTFLQDDPDPLFGLVGRLTAEETLLDALQEVERILAPYLAGRSLRPWEADFTALAQLPKVLLHGDLCGNQFLLNTQRQITGVVDWGRAHAGHPLRDFLFGEWSLELFEFEDDFGRFRREMWGSYQQQRKLSLPGHEAVHALFTLAEACSVIEQSIAQTELSDWQQKHRERCLAALQEII